MNKPRGHRVNSVNFNKALKQIGVRNPIKMLHEATRTPDDRVAESTLREMKKGKRKDASTLEAVAQGLTKLGFPTTAEDLIAKPPKHPYQHIISEFNLRFSGEDICRAELVMPPSFLEEAVVNEIKDGQLQKRDVKVVDVGDESLDSFWYTVARRFGCRCDKDDDEATIQSDIVAEVGDLSAREEYSPLLIVTDYSRRLVNAMNADGDGLELGRRVRRHHKTLFKRLPCSVLVVGTFRIRRLFDFLKQRHASAKNNSTKKNAIDEFNALNLLSEEWDAELLESISLHCEQHWAGWVNDVAEDNHNWHRLSADRQEQINGLVQRNPTAMRKAIAAVQADHDVESQVAETHQRVARDVWDSVPHIWQSILRKAGKVDRSTIGDAVETLQHASILTDDGKPWVAAWGDTWEKL